MNQSPLHGSVRKKPSNLNTSPLLKGIPTNSNLNNPPTSPLAENRAPNSPLGTNRSNISHPSPLKLSSSASQVPVVTHTSGGVRRASFGGSTNTTTTTTTTTSTNYNNNNNNVEDYNDDDGYSNTPIKIGKQSKIKMMEEEPQHVIHIYHVCGDDHTSSTLREKLAETNQVEKLGSSVPCSAILSHFLPLPSPLPFLSAYYFQNINFFIGKISIKMEYSSELVEAAYYSTKNADFTVAPNKLASSLKHLKENFKPDLQRTPVLAKCTIDDPTDVYLLPLFLLFPLTRIHILCS
jgi:hypothetical protein